MVCPRNCQAPGSISVLGYNSSNYSIIFIGTSGARTLKLTQHFRYVSLEKEEKGNFIIKNLKVITKYIYVHLGNFIAKK